MTMKRYFLFLTIFFAAALGSCKKDYQSLETNPNTPSVSTPQLTLAGSLEASAFTLAVSYPEYAVWGGYWVQSGNYVPTPALQQYQLTNTSYNGVWNLLYAELTNYDNLEKSSAKDASLANFKAICMIMKAYDFEALVDNFNDVPYSQAFLLSTILFPTYDKGANIYHDLGQKLDAAIDLINKNPNATSPGNSDIVFHGNMTGWKKFANTIKLRLAIRVSTKASGDPLVADLASTAAEGYLDGTIQAAANQGYLNVVGKENPFYATYGFDANGNPTFCISFYVANDYSVTTLQHFNDPCVNKYYALTVPVGGKSTDPPSVIRGNVFGDTKNALSNSYTSLIGAGILVSPTQNQVLMSGAESLFLQAEAVQDGFISPGPTAQSLYEAAITASFQSLGLTADQTTTNNTQNMVNVGWAASTDKEQAIITQKWIALNGLFPLEAYNEYRRTGFPNLPSSIDPAALSPT